MNGFILGTRCPCDKTMDKTDAARGFASGELFGAICECSRQWKHC